MKAFVTGATGCLGRNLVERLVSDGHEVMATGRNQAIGKRLRDVGAEFVRADIADANTLASAAGGCDTVFHCAALASPWGRYEDFYSANVMGTSAAVHVALRSHARLVHVSTPSIYFDFTDRLDIDEADPLPRRMVNHYAATKLEAEEVVDTAVSKHGLSAVTLRPRAIFGPYDTALFPRVLAAANGGRVPLIGRGHAVVDVTCVSNVVDAMLLAAEKAEALSGRKYNITNGSAILVRDLLAMAFGELGMDFVPRTIPYPLAWAAAATMEALASTPFGNGEPRLTRYSAGVMRFNQTLSIARARAELGYEPRKSTEEGVAEYARWRNGAGHET